MGWMVGAPPPTRQADSLRGWQLCSRFPADAVVVLATSAQLLPTRVVSRGDGPMRRAAAQRARRHRRRRLFSRLAAAELDDVAAVAGANYTDGILILHRGRSRLRALLRRALAADRQHLAFSVTKSFVATLAATLIAEAVLDDRATVASYLPELRESGLADATVRQLLDMATAPDYTEDYADPTVAGVGHVARRRFPGHALKATQGRSRFCRYIKTVKKAGPHGMAFAYKTVNTDALGAVLRRVTGKPLSELLSERLSSQLGGEQDAFFTVDPTGAEFAGGGLNSAHFAILRVSARRCAWVWAIQRSADRAENLWWTISGVAPTARYFAKAGYKTLPGWSYRNMWWVSHNPHGAFTARGIHGQGIYIDPLAEMVIVRFAFHPGRQRQLRRHLAAGLQRGGRAAGWLSAVTSLGEPQVVERRHQIRAGLAL